MPEPRDLHRHTTVLLSVILVVLGVALIVRTLTAGGGVASVGLLFGILLAVAGALRLYVEHRRA